MCGRTIISDSDLQYIDIPVEIGKFAGEVLEFTICTDCTDIFIEDLIVMFSE